MTVKVVVFWIFLPLLRIDKVPCSMFCFVQTDSCSQMNCGYNGAVVGVVAINVLCNCGHTPSLLHFMCLCLSAFLRVDTFYSADVCIFPAVCHGICIR